MVICKVDGSPDDQNQGDGGEGIIANDHPEDPASSVPLQMVVCKEICPSDGQNQRDGAEIRTRHAPSMEDPQYKMPAKTDQRFRS